MVHVFIFVLGVFVGNSICVEEDNLRNALNSIASRQRQLAASSPTYYVIPNKDVDKELPYDDDLMYLDSPSREYDPTNRETIGYGYHKPPSKTHHLYDDDRIPYTDSEDYQKELKERLLERLMLDILEDEDEPLSPPLEKPQKKSFFREREFSETPENLQNFYPNSDEEETIVLPASPFRERAKTKTRSHPRPVKPYEFEDNENESEDYGNTFNSLFDKYKGSAAQSYEPETITSDDVEDFLSYLNDKASQSGYDYNSALYPTKSKKRDEAKRKRYFGSGRNERYSIQKRSAVEEKPVAMPVLVSSTSTEKEHNATQVTTGKPVIKPQVNKTKVPKTVDSGMLEEPKPTLKKSLKGQKEVPVDIKSQEPLNIKKKSIDWSDYFGVDKRQKKSSSKDQQRKDEVLLDQYIQSYILQSVRNSAFNNGGGEYRHFPKREQSQYEPYPYEKMGADEDLRKAEDLIIDNVLKYTGAHDGVTDRKELERFKENVINELAAAYNLEKLRSEIFDDSKKKKADDQTSYHHTNNKRVAVKKESAEEELPSELDDLKVKHNATFFNQDHNKKPTHEHTKRRQHISLDKGSRTWNECPLLDKFIERCQHISYTIKDFDGTFIPSCILHQICHSCEISIKDNDVDTCDINFFSEINSICGTEPFCRYNAQRVFRAMSSSSTIKDVPYKCDNCIADILQYMYKK